MGILQHKTQSYAVGCVNICVKMPLKSLLDIRHKSWRGRTLVWWLALLHHSWVKVFSLGWVFSVCMFKKILHTPILQYSTEQGVEKQIMLASLQRLQSDLKLKARSLRVGGSDDHRWDVHPSSFWRGGLHAEELQEDHFICKNRFLRRTDRWSTTPNWND